jgi:hypothetical protein
MYLTVADDPAHFLLKPVRVKDAYENLLNVMNQEINDKIHYAIHLTIDSI